MIESLLIALFIAIAGLLVMWCISCTLDVYQLKRIKLNSFMVLLLLALFAGAVVFLYVLIIGVYLWNL